MSLEQNFHLFAIEAKEKGDMQSILKEFDAIKEDSKDIHTLSIHNTISAALLELSKLEDLFSFYQNERSNFKTINENSLEILLKV